MKAMMFNVMDFEELEDFVHKHLDREDWSLVVETSATNGCDYAYMDINSEDKPLYELNESSLPPRDALMHLCIRGILPAGNYLVQVWW